jgi:hypothetical protein
MKTGSDRTMKAAEPFLPAISRVTSFTQEDQHEIKNADFALKAAVRARATDRGVPRTPRSGEATHPCAAARMIEAETSVSDPPRRFFRPPKPAYVKIKIR